MPVFSRQSALLAGLLLAVVSISACHKKKPAEVDAPPPAAAPATSDNPAQTSAETSWEAAAEAATPRALSAEEKALAEKKKALADILAENTLLTDPKGQWAESATASSTRASDHSPQSHDSYAPWHATGKPNVDDNGLSTEAWLPAVENGGVEWLQVTFATPRPATALRIKQNTGPGAVIKIELLDDGGAVHTIFEGVDETQYEGVRFQWLKKEFPVTPYKVAGAKITLATNLIQGYNQIDAVQLVGE